MKLEYDAFGPIFSVEECRESEFEYGQFYDVLLIYRDMVTS